MNKPIKPKKPSRNDHSPSKLILKQFVLAKNNTTNEILLVNKITNPNLFRSDSVYDLIFNNNIINIDVNFERVSFNILQKVYNLINKNFEIDNYYNNCGYYLFTVISYEDPNDRYNQELEFFNSRFERYEQDLKIYEKELLQYQEYIKSEKKAKLEQQLNKLNNE